MDTTSSKSKGTETMNLKVELTEAEIMLAIAAWIEAQTGVAVPVKGLFVETKSKQNYKSEWEVAAIRVSCNVQRP
jgi:hypothetical protein